MRSFEIVKDGISERFQDTHINIRIPYSILDHLFDHEEGMCMDECYAGFCESQGFAVKAVHSARGGILRMDENVYQSLVKDCIDETVKCLRKYLDKMVKRPSIAFFVGGFSRCPFLTQALRQFCEAREMWLVASENVTPHLAVVYGASIYGKDPDWIASRIARFSIGVLAHAVFNLDKHDREKVVVINGQEMVPVFHPFAVRGGRVNERDEIRHSFTPISDYMPCVVFDIVNTRRVSPFIYSDDSDLVKLGELRILAPGEHRKFMRKDDIEVFFRLGSSLHFRAQSRLGTDCCVSLSLDSI
eukprot:TRINITY_DN10427_c0_g2_i1.p1 TRINITY_DN10427_c0_g2~~TRINITY_DN10427_c0_g2_i1.p1  ORF type:complete len:301 (+),score=60.26 TRINITY_DN10427_c0_g2_i1:439-1341(+)